MIRHVIFVYVGRSVSIKLDPVSTMLFYVFLRIFDDTEKNTTCWVVDWLHSIPGQDWKKVFFNNVVL